MLPEAGHVSNRLSSQCNGGLNLPRKYDSRLKMSLSSLKIVHLMSSGVSTSFHMPNWVNLADMDWPGSNRAPGESCKSWGNLNILCCLVSLYASNDVISFKIRFPDLDPRQVHPLPEVAWTRMPPSRRLWYLWGTKPISFIANKITS